MRDVNTQELLWWDPRVLLDQVVQRCRADGLHPVVACELEFYLVEPQSGQKPGAGLTPATLSSRPQTAANLSVQAIEEHAGLLGAMRDAALAQRLPVASAVVIWVAGAGILVNGVTALLFASGRPRDLNLRSVFVHMAADTFVTAAVAAAGVVIWLTDWLWLDPAVSLFVSAVIVIGTWGLVKSAIGLALDAVPEGVDATAVRAHLLALPGVTALHDLHIWGMSTTETALTCHLVMPDGHPGDAALNAMTHELHARFGIAHATLQIELADSDEICALTPEHVV